MITTAILTYRSRLLSLFCGRELQNGHCLITDSHWDWVGAIYAMVDHARLWEDINAEQVILRYAEKVRWGYWTASHLFPPA
jgi:hypothetical protein